MELTERQQNELDYHKERAREHAGVLNNPFSWAVLENPSSIWWNAYWSMYAQLSSLDLKGKKVLVVGCGFGDDALRIAKLGADVYAFDLSPDSLSIAQQLAEREELSVSFKQMPAETLDYENDFFDVILARDILHHVDIPLAIAEIARVAKPGAVFVVNEIYSHSFTEKIRRSAFIEKFLYPRMQKLIYGPGKPYITEDERKLSESDMQIITGAIGKIEVKRYFNFLVNRVIPDRFDILCKLDRTLMIVLKPIGSLLAGRILLSGTISKKPTHSIG
jgi:ubiquinone/menaquinone biosynthesis C-methylase UbiE